jgi:predicted dehydrogenase
LEKLRTSVVGLGNLGIVYARVLKELPESELVAVSTRNKKVLGNITTELGVEGYEDEATMLKKSDSQVVFIATPQGVHLRNTVTAMQAGNHVYCTKPMATTLREADQMIAASKQTRRKLEIGFHYRFTPHIQKIREVILSGQIGRVASTLSTIQQYRGEDYWSQGQWRAKKGVAGGGLLMTNYAHDLDFIQWFLGKPAWVSGYVDTLVQPIEVEDYASATIKFVSGAVSSFNLSTASWASSSPRLEIFGTKGAISLTDKKDASWKSLGTTLYIFADNAWNEVKIEQDKGIEARFAGRLLQWTVPLTGLSSVHSLFNHFSDFLKSIIANRKNSVDGAEGRKSLEIATGIYLSSKKGRRVKLPQRQ